jgi:hypothetical protein
MEANVFIKNVTTEGNKIKNIRFYGDWTIDIGGISYEELEAIEDTTGWKKDYASRYGAYYFPGEEVPNRDDFFILVFTYTGTGDSRVLTFKYGKGLTYTQATTVAGKYMKISMSTKPTLVFLMNKDCVVTHAWDFPKGVNSITKIDYNL